MAADPRPNILLIMADQWRWDYLGCMGADFVHTPNLDALAARGMLLTHCCSNAPVCVPARIALATGLQPARLGSLNNHSFLPLSAPTYYRRFRDAGYHVGCCGKLDLAKPDKFNGRRGERPCCYAWGFTHPHECEGKMHAGMSRPGAPLGPYGHYLDQRGLLGTFQDDYARRRAAGWTFGEAMADSALPTDAFEDVYIGRRAAAWIAEADADFPWHYVVSFVGPHDPYDPPSEYARRCRGVAMPAAIADDLAGKPRHIRDRALGGSAEQVALTRRQYAAAIACIDEQVGAILAALAESGQADRTWVFFTSDHGEMLGDHGLYQKSVAYEAALRVPLIAAGPGIAPGGRSEALVELADLNPTMTELAGLGVDERLDARSFAAVLSGGASEHREDCLGRLETFRCLRTRRWKLIENTNDQAELYDLENDPHELRNLAASEPDRLAALRRRLGQRLAEGAWQR